MSTSTRPRSSTFTVAHSPGFTLPTGLEVGRDAEADGAALGA